jgi:hypothetical protein
MEYFKFEKKETLLRLRIAEEKDISDINKLKLKVMIDTYVNLEFGITDEIIRKSFNEQEDINLA